MQYKSKVRKSSKLNRLKIIMSLSRTTEIVLGIINIRLHSD